MAFGSALSRKYREQMIVRQSHKQRMKPPVWYVFAYCMHVTRACMSSCQMFFCPFFCPSRLACSTISKAVSGFSKISYHIIPSRYAKTTNMLLVRGSVIHINCLCRDNLTKTIFASSCSVMATCMHGDISLEQMSPHPKTMTEPRAGFSLSPPRSVVYPNLELQPLPLLNKPPDVAISR